MRYYYFWMVAEKDGSEKNLQSVVSVDLTENKNEKAKKKITDLGLINVRILNSVEITKENYLECMENGLFKI